MKIQFEISEEREQEIRSLRSATGIKADKDLFYSALSLLNWAVQEVQKGHSIAAVDEAGMQYRELSMVALKHAASGKFPHRPSPGSGSLSAPVL